MSEELLSGIARQVVGKVGDEFMKSLVSNLRAVMKVSLAFIAEGVGEPPSHARARYSWVKNPHDKPIEYDLEGTPCQVVYAGKHFIVPAGLSKKFPKEAGFDSYCGTPLHSASGKVTGHLAVFSNRPIEHAEQVKAAIRIFGMRAEAELQRLAHEAEQERMIRKLEVINQRLARQHENLHKVSTFRAEILNVVAHDLRNPLQVIISRTELIKSHMEIEGVEVPTLGAKVNKSCNILLNTADRMERMIGSMLKSARSNATSFEIHSTNIQLYRPLRLALDLNQGAAKAKQITLLEKIDKGHHAWADEDRLVEAVENLISNAIKFSEPGTEVGIESTITMDHAEIKVTDNGPGMEKHEISQAFKPFRTFSARPTAGETSTGLGLAIVRSIATAHGGSVSINSRGRGKGCIFRLCLPLTETQTVNTGSNP